jgi:hypothetical protein
MSKTLCWINKKAECVKDFENVWEKLKTEVDDFDYTNNIEKSVC